jgi:hypothetical protein
MDYSPEVLKKIVPDAIQVQYLTSLFMRVMKCQWAQQLNRLHAPGPGKGARLPESRRMNGKGEDNRKSSEDMGHMSDDDAVLPSVQYDKDKLYSGLEWLMLIKTKGDDIATDGVKYPQYQLHRRVCKSTNEIQS